MWYDVERTLSYNCLFNFIIGNRGCGKTYGAKRRAIKNFIKSGKQFIYLRRNQTELDKVKKTLFNDLNANNEFDNHAVRLNHMGEYVYGHFDEETKDCPVCGWPMALATSADIKSSSYPEVSLIIFDEFIIDKGVKHYLKHEVDMFLDLYETIARMRDVTVLFLSNAVSFANPYTLYFNLSLPYNSNMIRKGDILLEMVDNPEYVDTKKKTRFAKIIEGTAYASYSIDNNFLRDNADFIEKKSGNCTCVFIFTFQEQVFGVWYNYTLGKIFVSYDIDKYCGVKYALTLDDHKENTLLVKGSKSTHLSNFANNYMRGCVFFESAKIKGVVLDALKLLIC